MCIHIQFLLWFHFVHAGIEKVQTQKQYYLGGRGYYLCSEDFHKILFWLIAPLFGVKRNFVVRNVGYPLYFDNSKSKKELAMDYIPIEKTIIDFFQQFLDEKIA